MERLPSARWCISCGSALARRAREEIRRELNQVRDAIARWREVERTLVAAFMDDPAPVAPLGSTPAAVAKLHANPSEQRAAEREAMHATDAAAPPGSIPAEPNLLAAQRIVKHEPVKAAAASVAEVRANSSEPRVPPPVKHVRDHHTEAPDEPDRPTSRLVKTAAALAEPVPKATAEQKVVDAASTWRRVWRPFLTESIGWFIGAFLILAGAFYGVAESWSSMTSAVRSLVVFGLTAAWSVGLWLWSSFLARREATRAASRVLSLIAAAVAPLAAVALNPGLETERSLASNALVYWPLLLSWAFVVAFLGGRAARAYDVTSRRALQLLSAATALILGAAPLLAPTGSAVLWLNALPAAVVWWTSAPNGRSVEQRAFALLAPAYLAALAGIRIHLALDATGQLPAVGTYAPFAAVALLAALRAMPLAKHRAADALHVGAAAVFVGLCAASVLGEAPALFATTALGAGAFASLAASGPDRRARWLYLAYGFGYLAFHACYQLVPSALDDIIAAVKQAFGYESKPLPYNYDGLYALLYVVPLALVGARLLPTRRAIGEALLNASAVSALLFGLVAMAGTDQRPALYALPILGVVFIGLGMWLERPALGRVGGVAAVLLAVSLALALPQESAALATSAVALVLALAASLFTAPNRTFFSGLVAAQCALVLVEAFVAGGAAGAAALAMAAVAALIAARNVDRPLALGAAYALTLLAVPRMTMELAPELSALTLATSALGAAVLAERRGRLEPLAAVAPFASALAVGWQWVAQSGPSVQLLGPVLLVAAATVFVASRIHLRVRPLGALFACAALLPHSGALSMWPWMTPELSAALYAAVSVGASAWSSWRGRSVTASLFAALAILGGAAAALSGGLSFSLCALAAAAALASMTALHPAVSVPLATLWGLGFCVPSVIDGNGWPLLGVALGVSLLALLEEWDGSWNRILAGRPVTMVASICALVVVSAAWLSQVAGWRAGPVAVAIFAVLPLVWVRTTRAGVFGAAVVVCLGAFAGSSAVPAWTMPAAAVVVTRLAVAQRIFFFGRDERRAVVMNAAVLGALAACSALWLLANPSDGKFALATSAAFLVAAGPALRVRLAAGAAFAALSPNGAFAAIVLMALAVATYRWPKVLHRVLGADVEAGTQQVAAVAGMALATWSCFMAPGYMSFAISSVAFFLGASLLAQRFLLAAAVPLLATAACFTGLAQLEPIPEAALVALVAAVFALAVRHRAVEATLRRALVLIGPGVERPASALWLGSVLSVAAMLALSSVRPLSSDEALPLVASCAALLVTPSRAQVWAACALLGVSVALAVPLEWTAAAVAAVGLGICVGGHYAARAHPAGLSVQDAGALVALAALAAARELHHIATPLAFALVAATAWIVVSRRKSLEPLAWLATLVALHVLLFHAGVVLSTGKPRVFILPYVGASSAVLGAAALAIGQRSARRFAGLGMAAVALFEVAFGLALIAGPVHREAAVAFCGLAALAAVLASRALRRADSFAGCVAIIAFALGYLVVRLHGAGAVLGSADALAALVGGALFSGLYGLALREERGGVARAALFGSFALPLAGLVAAPWNEAPLVVALLLGGHSAHFAALALVRPARRIASVAAAAAFNAGLFCAWWSSSPAEPQYFVIPAGLSALGLLRVFRDDFSAEWLARIRAVVVAVIYAAAAWKPLTFEGSWPMLICVAVCVVGVAAGVALRIRSYVYLGTGFLVTTVVANLVRHGVRDPRLGAVFLSALGLLVVGFMVVFTARRAELAKRYHRVRRLLEQWEG